MLPTATKLSAGKDKSRAARCCAALSVSKCFGITTGRASAMLAYRQPKSPPSHCRIGTPLTLCVFEFPGVHHLVPRETQYVS